MNPVTWQLLSKVFGCASVCTWLCAQLPQIYENWKLKSVEGLSPTFLGIWILGDLTGLIGCILTGQKGFQTILSSYYVCTDLVLCIQYYNYSTTRPVVLVGVSSDGERDNSNRKGAPITFRKRLGSLVSVVSAGSSLGRAVAIPVTTPIPAQMTIAAINRYRQFGYSCAYISTIMYVISRIPQIYHNMKRQSVEGVSPLLFCATLFGNTMYTSSILCASMAEPDQRAFLLNELSYIIGSAGTILFDVVIFLQFYVYRQQKGTPEFDQLDPSQQMYVRLVNKPVVLMHPTIYSSITD